MSAKTSLPSKNLIIIIAIVVAVIVAGISVFGTFNSIRNQGIEKENALEEQYRGNQNELSTYVLKIKETLGIADRGNNKVDEILVDAIKGRYDGNMAPGTGGSMFSAITEAYPDLTANTALYAKVQDAIISGRDAYKNAQNKLLNMIRAYENWSQQGFVNSAIVNMLGFPSEALEARIGDKTYTGKEALNRMKDIVLVKDATTAYETGEMAPLVEPETTK